MRLHDDIPYLFGVRQSELERQQHHFKWFNSYFGIPQRTSSPYVEGC